MSYRFDCPQCGKERYYSFITTFYSAKKHQRLCSSCGHAKGWANRPNSTHIRKCPTCQREISYRLEGNGKNFQDIPCRLCWQKNRRQRNCNFDTHQYERDTKKGFLVRTYRNMKSRVEGIQTNKLHLYYGLPLLDKKTFYEWSLKDKSFNDLYDVWQTSGKIQALVPSIDRINQQDGYVVGNIQWITLSENSSKATIQ